MLRTMILNRVILDLDLRSRKLIQGDCTFPTTDHFMGEYWRRLGQGVRIYIPGIYIYQSNHQTHHKFNKNQLPWIKPINLVCNACRCKNLNRIKNGMYANSSKDRSIFHTQISIYLYTYCFWLYCRDGRPFSSSTTTAENQNTE